MLNRTLISVSMAAALAAGMNATTAQAEDAFEISGNVALTTDYRFRGISQTDEEAAVQGGFDVAFEPGFYIGTWGSSVDFGGGVYGSLELDYYAGWAGMMGDTDFGIDVGYIYYDYPGDKGCCEGDYQEVYANVSYMDASFGVAYSDDYYGETEDFWYLQADYGFALPGLEALQIGLHVGYNILDEDESFLGPNEDEYLDYSVSATYSYGTADFTLSWVGTDLDKDDVGTAVEEIADDTIVFAISKSL